MSSAEFCPAVSLCDFLTESCEAAVCRPAVDECEVSEALPAGEDSGTVVGAEAPCCFFASDEAALGDTSFVGEAAELLEFVGSLAATFAAAP